MQRRHVLGAIAGAAVSLPLLRLAGAAVTPAANDTRDTAQASEVGKVEKTDAQWQEQLSPEAYKVLRKESTEAPGSSELNTVKAEGEFVCAGCELPLFKSGWKYESGTGWPSFYDYIDGHLEFKRDFRMLLPRTEYHCARCGGHQGHVFKDGPEPTGKRYCNNGVALNFLPAGNSA